MRSTWLSGMAAVAGWLATFGVAPAQQAGFNYGDFSSLAGLTLQGQAVQDGSRIRLITPAPNQAGAVWTATRLGLGEGFETVFRFQMAGEGEGFAFVVQNNVLPGLGPAGEGLGYAGLPRSLAVEFDRRQNSSNDFPAPHISVQCRGIPPNSADADASLGAVATNLPAWADGNPHTGRIVCLGSRLEVYVDDLAQPLLSVQLPAAEVGEEGKIGELLGLEDAQAWIGFTATSSEAATSQDLLSWSFTPAPSPLTVSLAGPNDGASYLCPARISIEANVVSTGAVMRVEFYEGANRLGEVEAAPWVFEWKEVIPGSYWLSAVAVDETGRQSASVPVKVTVYPTAPSIGLNFCTGTKGFNYSLGWPEQAGVVEQRVWNNLVSTTDGNGSAYNLRDGSGAITPLAVTWDFAAPGEESASNPTLSSDYKLMRTYVVNHRGTEGGPTNSVIILQRIPFPVYDLLVYSDGANGLADCVAEFRVNNNLIYLRDGPGASFAGGFAEAKGAADQNSSTPAGNFVRFQSLSNSTVTLYVTARSSSDGMPRAAVNAIQVVPSVDTVVPLRVSRGPYLQSATPTSMIVRWRSSKATDTRLRYGTASTGLNEVIDQPEFTTEHIVQVTNLFPGTRYFYAVGSSETNLMSGDTCYFTTSPTNARLTRIWVSGDTRDRTPGELAVRNSYYSYIEEDNLQTDVWLNLGDNGGINGTDAQLQSVYFDVFADLLRTTPTWLTIGNHDTFSASGSGDFPHLRSFSFPTNGEAGGVPSGTLKYYSFDFLDIHFVCLDSQSSDRSVGGPMHTWLQRDLAANRRLWVIAFFHHAPYSKGGHDSDSESEREMNEMRQNFVPVLEEYGVDLVLTGHSHNYERSFLIDGNYDTSDTFSAAMVKNSGDGRIGGSGPYIKATNRPAAHQGTVYVLAGSSANIVSPPPPLNHPAMFYSANVFGSLVINVEGNRMDVKFMRETRVFEDYFTLLKQEVAEGLRITQVSVADNLATLSWESEAGKSYTVLRTTSLSAPDWQPVSGAIVASGASTTWSQALNPGEPSGFYRVETSGK